MIDFNEIIKVATATATKATTKTTKTVPNQEVADKIMWLSERGYIPDEQTEHIVRAYLLRKRDLRVWACGRGLAKRFCCLRRAVSCNMPTET